MTPKNDDTPPGDDSRGVLDDAASLETAAIGILGGTAQVSVQLPKDEDDDLADDEVVDGEIAADLVIDEIVAAEPRPVGRFNATDIVIEIPAEAGRTDAVDATASEVGPRRAVLAGASPDAAPAAPRAAEPTTVTDVIEATVVDEPAAPTTVAAPTQVVQEADLVDVAGSREEEAAARFVSQARADASADAVSPFRVSQAASTPVTTRSAPRRKEIPLMDTRKEKAVAPQTARPATRTDVTLTSKRLGELAEPSRESADLLTADRLLDPHQVARPEPEGAWSHFLYTISGRRINIGDGRRARERKTLTGRIAAPLTGGARFVPVLSRKGGVGKTTITTLLGMALADAREDRVIAVDANPDRGTLAERVVRSQHSRSVRDLVRIHDDVKGYHDISAIVARDATRLDVLASDSDPRIAEAFSDTDYRDVAEVAAHYYSLVLTDTGTGIVHSVMSATLDLADQIVIVSGLSVDEARLASETLTWLETNGHAERAREAIVVLNQSTPGTPLVRLNELEAHFATRARNVVRMPYDAQIAGGGPIVFANLRPETRTAARELAALLVEGLRTRAA